MTLLMLVFPGLRLALVVGASVAKLFSFVLHSIDVPPARSGLVASFLVNPAWHSDASHDGHTLTLLCHIVECTTEPSHCGVVVPKALHSVLPACFTRLDVSVTFRVGFVKLCYSAMKVSYQAAQPSSCAVDSFGLLNFVPIPPAVALDHPMSYWSIALLLGCIPRLAWAF